MSLPPGEGGPAGPRGPAGDKGPKGPMGEQYYVLPYLHNGSNVHHLVTSTMMMYQDVLALHV